MFAYLFDEDVSGMRTYDELKQEVIRLRQEGKVPFRPDMDSIVDWVYSHLVIENPQITREMVRRTAERMRG